jgi:hypothetical protein
MIFTPPPAITMEEATTLAVELFGVTEEHASRETRQQKGGYYSQQWLFEVYQRQCYYQVYGCAARAYLLLLIGCTIFAYKSYMRVDFLGCWCVGYVV